MVIGHERLEGEGGWYLRLILFFPDLPPPNHALPAPGFADPLWFTQTFFSSRAVASPHVLVVIQIFKITWNWILLLHHHESLVWPLNNCFFLCPFCFKLSAFFQNLDREESLVSAALAKREYKSQEWRKSLISWEDTMAQNSGFVVHNSPQHTDPMCQIAGH